MTRQIDTDTLGFLVGDISRMLRAEMDRAITAAGLELRPAEARALVSVAVAGPARQSAIAERMGVEAMTVCGFIDRLEERGLVVREPDPTDRRAKLVRVTDAADEVIDEIGQVTRGLREMALSDISHEEWQVLRALLKRVRANLSQSRADARPERAA